MGSLSTWAIASLALLGVSSVVEANLRLPLPGISRARVEDVLSTTTEDTNSNSSYSTFQQLIDHEDADLGIFTQRYLCNWRWYSGPGAPIILTTPGESGLDNLYFDLSPSQLYAIDISEFNGQSQDLLAKRLGAGQVILEHRYFGMSWPTNDTSTEGQQYNTVQNAIADLTHFAREVKLPFDTQEKSHAPDAPWVLMGGSMAGALTAWVEKLSPGTFWAYWASSATVEGISSWSYTIPILENMPQNCSADVAKVVAHIDEVGTNGTQEEQDALKAVFGLEAIEHYIDFARYVSTVL
jgi:hypothetical protein